MTNAPWQHRPGDMPTREYPFAPLLDTPRRRRILPRLTVRGWFVLLTFAMAIGIVIYEAIH